MEKNFFLKIFRRFFCDIKSVFAKYNYSWSSATLVLNTFPIYCAW